MGIVIMSEDLPEAHNRVTLDPHLTDSDGIPAPKIDYTVSDNTWGILDHGIARATEALEAAGAKRVIASKLRRNAGWHLLGTARMGSDPDTSVVDRWGRAHDVPQPVHHRREHFHHGGLHKSDHDHSGAGAADCRLPVR